MPYTQVRIGPYVLPNCLQSLENRERLLFMDLPGMPNERLYAEKHLVALAYSQGLAEGCREMIHHPDSRKDPMFAVTWLRERLEAVEREIERRTAGGR